MRCGGKPVEAVSQSEDEPPDPDPLLEGEELLVPDELPEPEVFESELLDESEEFDEVEEADDRLFAPAPWSFL